MAENQMFCYQCEQTAKGQGCTMVGVCGKTPDIAALQDLLIYSLKNLSQVAMDARKIEIHDEKVDVFGALVLSIIAVFRSRHGSRGVCVEVQLG